MAVAMTQLVPATRRRRRRRDGAACCSPALSTRTASPTPLTRWADGHRRRGPKRDPQGLAPRQLRRGCDGRQQSSSGCACVAALGPAVSVRRVSSRRTRIGRGAAVAVMGVAPPVPTEGLGADYARALSTAPRRCRRHRSAHPGDACAWAGGWSPLALAAAIACLHRGHDRQPHIRWRER